MDLTLVNLPDYHDGHCIYKGEDEVNNIRDNCTAELTVSAVLMSCNITQSCILNFWLLLLGGLLVFFAWIAFFSRQAKLWGPEASSENAFSTVTHPIETSDNSINDTPPVALLCVDIWFALTLMAGVDAFAIVINFNRSLIHQLHYFISLRMTLLAVIIPTAILLLHDNKSSTLSAKTAIFLLCCIVYRVSIPFTHRLHRLIPARGIGASRSSLQNYSEKMCLFDLRWRRNLLFAAINGAVGLGLTTLVPIKWSMLSPVVHITWKVGHTFFLKPVIKVLLLPLRLS